MQLSDSNKQVVIGSLIGAGMLCLGIWYYQFMAGSGAIESRAKKVVELTEEVRGLEGRLKRARELKENEGALQASFEKVGKIVDRLPRTPDVSQFHQILANLVSRTGVIPVNRVTEQAHASRTYYTEIPYTFECIGRYHSIGELLNLIEESPERLMRITRFKITNDSPLVVDHPSLHYASIEITTYSYTPTGESMP
jgi:Tfp pilus assembly protein PilO